MYVNQTFSNADIYIVLLTNETLWDGIIMLCDTHLNLKNNDLDYE